MTCIERDINREITKQIIEARIPAATFDIDFYADDTKVVFRSKEACEEFLEQIERISGQYGLELNKDICVNLNNMDTDEHQTFRGRDKLIKAEEATYLGNTLNSKADATMEVEKQMQ